MTYAFADFFEVGIIFGDIPVVGTIHRQRNGDHSIKSDYGARLDLRFPRNRR